MRIPILIFAAGLFLAVAKAALTAVPAAASPDRLSLAGSWRVRLDLEDVGRAEGWHQKPLVEPQRMELPGTTDLAGLGPALDPDTLRYPVEFPYTRFPGVSPAERADERGFLVRPHLVLGPVWYERDLEVPDDWRDRRLIVHLERALWQTDLWLDGRPCGTANSLATPHVHDVGRVAPGRHRLTLRVDNRMSLNLSTITHAYGPETQSRWNGVIGALELRALPAMAIRGLQVFPAPDRRSVGVILKVDGDDGQGRVGEALVQLSLRSHMGGRALATAELPVRSGLGETTVETRLAWDQPAEPWDEFRPNRYRVEAGLRTGDGAVSRSAATFGFRRIERQGRALLVNGRRIFLRGTLDCAVYPKSGHPPMTEVEWERVFRTVKQHGFNHVRFHTWCPPEAAFEVADRLGLYLMPETAAWIDDWTRETEGRPPAIGRDAKVNEFIRDEIRRIGEAYGNHPSFVLFCVGNEFGMQGTDWEAVAGWVAEAKARDPRRLYLGTTARRSLAPDDFWVTHAVHGKAARGVGPPRTDWDFSEAAEASGVPIIAHETGQRPVFPDYADLLPKFTGPLRPLNYQRLRERLAAHGLTEQIKDFETASARFQWVQYKAEHEALRRTADFAGYQLLMLNDFTGQSEALVGILDPFWESKGVVPAAEIRAWNQETVPLARFPKYTWSTLEAFRAQLEVAHHGPHDLEAVPVDWKLIGERNRSLGEGSLGPRRIPTGGITRLGQAEVSMGELTRPVVLTLRLRVGEAINNWSIWAYPPPPDETDEGLVVTGTYGEPAERALAEGRPVILLAHGVQGPRAARTGFESVYWSAGWWGNEFSSLGIRCDPRHPALAGFPNQGHSDWQWWELTQGATTFRLEGAPRGFRPVVQAVPDFHFGSLLGQVFEAKVGGGRLLVCGYDLERDLDRRPAARQFRASLWRYAKSPGFRPRETLAPALVRSWLAPDDAAGGGGSGR